MKIWDSIIPLALIGYDAFNEGLITDANKINDLIKDVNKQFPKGSDLLLKDYFDFIKNKNIDEVSQFSAFWVSKNLKLYVSQNLKSIIEQKEFLNIFSTFFKLSFNNTAFNFSKFIEKNYNGNMKSREGMIEYVSLTENFINNIFSEIKSRWLVGSSSNKISGRCNKSLANSIRIRQPPLNSEVGRSKSERRKPNPMSVRSSSA